MPEYGFFRTGRNGSFVDNAATGEFLRQWIFFFGCVSSDGCDEYGNVYLSQPETGRTFKNFVFPKWNEAVSLCVEAAKGGQE